MATIESPSFRAENSKRGPPRSCYEAVKILYTNRNHNPDYLRFRAGAVFLLKVIPWRTVTAQFYMLKVFQNLLLVSEKKGIFEKGGSNGETCSEGG
jgi:hypothetical protein